MLHRVGESEKKSSKTQRANLMKPLFITLLNRTAPTWCTYILIRGGVGQYTHRKVCNHTYLNDTDARHIWRNPIWMLFTMPAQGETVSISLSIFPLQSGKRLSLWASDLSLPFIDCDNGKAFTPPVASFSSFNITFTISFICWSCNWSLSAWFQLHLKCSTAICLENLLAIPECCLPEIQAC